MIRDAGPADANAVAALIGAVETGRGENARSSSVRTMVALLGGRVVGVIEIVRRGPDAAPFDGFWLHSLAVSRWLRGMGIGTRLTEAAIGSVAVDGARMLTLTVSDDNTRAVSLYDSLGFAPLASGTLVDLLEGEAGRTGRRRIALRLELGDPAGMAPRRPTAGAATGVTMVRRGEATSVKGRFSRCR